MKTINVKHWTSDKDIKILFSILKQKNEESRFIGGCVRDLLIKKKDADIDMATTIVPNKVLELLKKNNIKTLTSGISHGTVIALINKRKFEITTLRKDIKTDGRHAVVEFTKDWIIDSKRRDFTINAISCDFKGNLYDYHNGIGDLKKGKINFIGDTKKRIKEDYLRILRFFRFYAYYGKQNLNRIDLQFCKDYSFLLKKLSSERIYLEFKKILESDYSYKTLNLMKKNNILKYIIFSNVDLSKIENLEKIDKNKKYVNFHLKFSSILSDNTKSLNKTVKFLKLPNIEVKKINKIFLYKKNFVLGKTKKNILKSLYLLGKDLFIDLVILECIKKRRNNASLKKYLNTIDLVKKLRLPKFPIEGKDVLNSGVIPGPLVGKILQQVEKWWIENEFKPNKKECINKIKNL